MPELPEVETIRRTLEPRLVGRTFVQCAVLRDDVVRELTAPELSRWLVGQAVGRLSRKGKYLLFDLEPGPWLAFHFGMTGKLLWAESAGNLAPHTHMLAQLDDDSWLIYIDPRRFGRIIAGRGPLESAGEIVAMSDRLGPDAWSVTESELAQRLGGSSQSVKARLLDQRLLAGLGNIYADEALFRARINPLVPANLLNARQWGDLAREIRQLLREAVSRRGTTFSDYRDADDRPGEFKSLLLVYGRKGEPCAVCGRPIERSTVAGRGTHFCPRCQPDERHSPGDSVTDGEGEY